MSFTDWKTERIENILPEDFYALIEKNAKHIEKTFPVTLSHCLDLEKTKKESVFEYLLDGYFAMVENEFIKENFPEVEIQYWDEELREKCVYGELAYSKYKSKDLIDILNRLEKDRERVWKFFRRGRT